jgi:hypothetical protein
MVHPQASALGRGYVSQQTRAFALHMLQGDQGGHVMRGMAGLNRSSC